MGTLMNRTVKYIFERAGNTVQAAMSSNRASTDSINALEKWILGAEGRHYEIRNESGETLHVTLAFDDVDENAGSDLHNYCVEAGVQRKLDQFVLHFVPIAAGVGSDGRGPAVPCPKVYDSVDAAMQATIPVGHHAFIAGPDGYHSHAAGKWNFFPFQQ